MKLNKSNFFSLFLAFFILVSSMLGTTSEVKDSGLLKSYNFPVGVSSFFYFLYFAVFGFFSLLGFLSFFRERKFLNFFVLIYISYFLLFFWSLVTASDQLRYTMILIGLLSCPAGLLYVMEHADLKVCYKVIVSIFLCLLVLSIVYSFLNYPTHSRISGIHNNPNLMGMWLVSTLSAILYFEDFFNKKLMVFIVVLVLALVFLSGSRLAFGALFIILIPFFFRYKFLSILALLFIVFCILFFGVNLDFRAVDMSSAVSDSGRVEIWRAAFSCVLSEPIVGHGMLGAEHCVNVINVHNSYLRIAVMVGVPLFFLFFLLFFIFLINIFLSPINPYVKFYFLSLPVFFFAEDYVSGFATPFFPYMIYMLALVMYDLKGNSYLRRGSLSFDGSRI